MCGHPFSDAGHASMVDDGAMARLLALLAAGLLLAGCEEDMGQDDWLRIQNNTGERVYVQEGDQTGDGYLIGVGPGESEPFEHEVCDSELVARSATTDGPVVGTRPPDEQGDCTGTWVIGPTAESGY